MADPRLDTTTLAHYYRGEMGRMASWRDRIDRTTNWAIGAVAAMLSVSLSSPTAHHGVLLFAMLLVLLLLGIEARRYRFFDVYRRRVRILERHYFSDVFDPGARQHPEWARELAASLAVPTFSITLGEALARRLRRNYSYIFLILLIAWAIKATTSAPPEGRGAVFVHTRGELFANASLGPLPGSVVIAVVLLLYGGLAYVMVRHREKSGELAIGDVHV